MSPHTGVLWWCFKIKATQESIGFDLQRLFCGALGLRHTQYIEAPLQTPVVCSIVKRLCSNVRDLGWLEVGNCIFDRE